MQADGRQVQLGTIYIQLMASMMLGSVIAATLMSGPWFLRPEKILTLPLLLSAYALLIAACDYQVRQYLRPAPQRPLT